MLRRKLIIITLTDQVEKNQTMLFETFFLCEGPVEEVRRNKNGERERDGKKNQTGRGRHPCR